MAPLAFPARAVVSLNKTTKRGKSGRRVEIPISARFERQCLAGQLVFGVVRTIANCRAAPAGLRNAKRAALDPCGKRCAITGAACNDRHRRPPAFPRNCRISRSSQPTRRHAMRSFTFALLGTALLGANLAAHAASFCATTSAELQADLAAAASNNQDNTIDVHLGTYAVPAGGFMYDTITNNHSLDLEGGWYGSSPGQCLAQQFTGNETVLDGQNADPVMSILTGGNNTTGNITLRYFTFQNGLGDPPSLFISTFTSTGAIRVENSLFRGNHVKADNDIVKLASNLGVVYFLDNAIVDNVGFPA